MKQAINFLNGYQAGLDTHRGFLMLVGWSGVFSILLFWGLSQNILYGNDKESLQLLQQQQQEIIKKISRTNERSKEITNQSLISSVKMLTQTNQKKKDFLNLIDSPRQSSLVHLLSDISRSYVEGTVIEYLHIKDQKLMRYQGSALKPALVPNVVNRLNSAQAFKKEDLIKIKVNRTKANENHVQFSIQAQ